MAKTESKTTKKSRRRLKRSVRKTLGTLFLVSAIVVAAIPVDGLQAWNGDTDSTPAGTPTKVWVADEANPADPNAVKVIPTVDEGTDVYYSANNEFEFALLGLSPTQNKPNGLMALHYESNNNLSAVIEGTLNIENTYDIYYPYGNQGLCAVGTFLETNADGSRKPNYLFYRQSEQYRRIVSNENGTQSVYYGYMVKDMNGIAVQAKPNGAPGFVINEGRDAQWVLESTESGLTTYTYEETQVSGNGTIGLGPQTYQLETYSIDYYYPCLAKDKSSETDPNAGWGKFDEKGFTYNTTTGERLTEGLYYEKTPASDGKAAEYGEVKGAIERLKDIPLLYIGNQVVENGKVTANYIKNSGQGIFSGQKVGTGGSSASITTVRFGENLLGIGDFAFHSSSISGVEFSGGMSVIGDYAFANCKNLTKVQFEQHGLLIIGAHAFDGCASLKEFKAPYTLNALGDAAFKDCVKLKTINLSEGDEGASSFQRLGYYAFEGCSSLNSLEFPSDFKEKVPISTIKGCTGLKFIRHLSTATTDFVFADDKDAMEGVSAGYTLDEFRESLSNLPVPNTDFYFEGAPGTRANPSALHQMARENMFAFKYINENIYEITNISYNDGDNETKYMATYQAKEGENGEADSLTQVIIEEGMENVTIPGAIGPCRVTAIGASSFQDNCNLKSVTIPSTIAAIEANAFRGCHNLTTVTFEYDKENPNRAIDIPNGTFATQDISGVGHTGCTPPDTPQLFFEGPISPSFRPFAYAMDSRNTINYGAQKGPTYITYCSGWPSNLIVRYNAATDKNELIAYPTISNIMDDNTGIKYEDDPIKWTNLNYIKRGGYKGTFDGGISSALSSYLANDNTINGNQSDLIKAVLELNLPDGIGAVAWSEPTGTVSGSDSGVIGIPAAEKVSLFTANETKEPTMLAGRKQIATNGMEILPRTFENCDTLKTAYIQGNTESMGDYAFAGCDNLSEVEIPEAMRKMGKRPFAGCEKLSEVKCPGNEYFTCTDSILFGPSTDTTGAIIQGKSKIVECLGGRMAMAITKEDLAGATQMEEEAFAGTKVVSVDLTDTTIKSLPQGAFQFTEKLFLVQLPYELTSINKNAFSDSDIQNLQFTGDKLGRLDSEAFGDTVHEAPYTGLTDIKKLIIFAQPGSFAEEQAKELGITVKSTAEISYYTVEFYDVDMQTLLYSIPHVQNGTSINVDKLVADGTIEIQVPAGKKVTWRPQNYDPVIGNPGDTTIKINAFLVDDDITYKVTFVDSDFATIEVQEVSPAGRVSPPPMEPKDGVPFSGWVCVSDPKYNIRDLQKSAESLKNDTIFMAQYGEVSGFTVTFQNWDGTVLWAKPGVQAGESVTYPIEEYGTPRRKGYTFKGWSGDTSNITKDVMVFAIFELDPSGSGGSGNGDGSGGNGSVSGGNGNSTADATYYTLTVRNGSGSGSYVAGSQAIIVANDPPAGQEFKNWSIEPTDTKIASTGISATVITMPEKNVTVVANYQTKSSVNSGGGSTVSGNSTNRPGTTSSVNKGGTTVIINKNGLSNTGVVSATVNGSSDNFTIKVSESSAASEAVVKALMAEYANDLSGISYFPMDISLYDSTGQKKITDTSGLKITITLPLPDALKDYAGNNKVAGVVNDRLDKLTPKFTTISGVPCITFTAEHFSPYVIYVDTRNLGANGTADSTPKTGDGIHPKWFLSSGLGCLSIIFFMKKDRKKEKKPVKAKA